MAATLVLPDQLRTWLIGKTINILITGKTGVGKSALVNSLMGAKIAPEGDDLKPTTMEVTSYTAQVNGVNIVIWDSPGLQDGSDNEEQYIEDMKRKCPSYDLVLYCTRMNETRYPTTDDVKAITTLTAHFGQQFWDNTVYVLTFANVVLPTRRDPDMLCTKFQQLKAAIPDVMTVRCGVTATAACSIPVVAAGYMEEAGEGRALPPMTSDWLSTLWFTAVLKMKESAQPAMLVANIDRITRVDDTTARQLPVRQSQGVRQQIACPGIDHQIQNTVPILKVIGIVLERAISSDVVRNYTTVGQLIGTAIGTAVSRSGGSGPGAMIGSAVGGAVGFAIAVVTEYFKYKDSIEA